jgi:glycosyltransferase involved in cell wall biosynthesis
MEVSKILWVKSDFLHPTTRGGQIRTLEMLQCLHRRHEVHYIGFHDSADPEAAEGVRRSHEYSTRSYPVPFRFVPKTSPKFFAQIAASAFDPVPAAVGRFRSDEMRRTIAELTSKIAFDSIVCDFLVPAINFPSMQGVVLFQHNVESVIWERRAQHAGNPAERAFMRLQARRMREFEKKTCVDAGAVIAVSQSDADLMKQMFGLSDVGWVATGVNIEYFARPPKVDGPAHDLVFIGSMDWMPNVDGMQWFVREVLPLIRRQRPGVSLAVVGRNPPPEIQSLAHNEPGITVTGTVPDVRPYLWNGNVSIVPLRIGGGTRLKIYESMAAGTPVVSTAVGAEGLAAVPPREIRIADDAEGTARECLELLSHANAARQVSEAALRLVTERFSWDQVTDHFERLMHAALKPSMSKSHMSKSRT